MPDKFTGLQAGIFIDAEIAKSVQGRWIVHGVDRDVKVLATMLLLAPPSLTVTVMVAVP